MEFKRINFFKGFFTQAEDWKDSQEYHLEKRKIHNRFLHTPGIVYGCLDNLKVNATEEGTSLYIGPGYAIDGEGRDLYLPRPDKIPINPQEFNPPSTVYIVISYDEEAIDLRTNVANPEYSGRAFIKECPKLRITKDEPDNHYVIELARIRLSREATGIRNPEQAENPGNNEIDIRYIRKAGATTRPVKLEDLGDLVKEGEISVVPSMDPMPLEEDTNVLIERIASESAHRFYVVSAYPVEEGRILWRIESIFSRNAVEYRLFLKNISERAANVVYRVYRLY